MADTPANMRPKNADGTVNWSVVFDDPNRGILQAVDQAKNITQLSGLINQIAPLLFQRKNDAAVREEFLKKMNGVLGSGTEADFDAIKANIRSTLESEKVRRIEEAKKYVANKRLGQSLERRRSNWTLAPGALFFGTPRRIVMTLSVLFVIAAGITYLTVDIDKLITASTSSEETAAENTPTAEEQAPEEPAPAPPATIQPQPKPKPKDEMYPVFLMKPLTFLFGNARLSLVPVIVAPEYDDKDTICGIAPRIAEALNFALGPRAAQGQAVTNAELASIAAKLRTDMDKYLGEDKIKNVYLIDTRKFDQAALRAAYRGCGMTQLKTHPKELRSK